jgi:hypothetical protein
MKVLWDLKGLTADMGLSSKILVPIQVKPKATEQAVNNLETITTSGYRSQFIVESFDKTAIGSTKEIVGNGVKMVAKGLEKWVKTGQGTLFNFSGPLFQTTPTLVQLKRHVENGG